MQRIKWYLLTVLLVLGCISPNSYSQGIITGGISGTVVDPAGAIIPGALAKVVSESTGTSFQVLTNNEGAFQIADVPLGSYSVSITASGFGSATVNHVQVVAGNISSIGKLTLSVGSAATQTVEVEASGSELINTESAQVETTIDSEQVQSAPVTGALDNLALMVPGVVNTHTFMSNTNGISYSVNGQRGRSNNSEIDGQTNNDTSIGGPSFFFDNQDAIQEVQVVSSSMGAQYGRNMGAVVNYITKNGTNAFHGSGFEIYTGSWLSSLMQYQKDPNFGGCAGSPDCHINPPKFVQNNWGGTFGGPILKDKLWFFGSTLWSHTFEGGVVLTSQGALFPDPNGLTTLQSAFGNNPAVAALTSNGPFASKLGSPTPIASTVTTIPVTDGTTTANVEVAGYQRTFPDAIYDQEHLGRLDFAMTPKDRIYLRYNYQNNPYNPGFYLVSNATAAAGGYPNVYPITHETGGDWTHTFTPTLLNQLRYAFQQSSIGFYGGAIPTCTIADFGPCTSTVTLGSPLNTYGYGGGLPQGRFVKVNQVQDNASWNRGRHAIMFGTEIDYQDSPWGFLPSSEGTFNFTPGAATNATYPNGIPFRNLPNASYNNGLTGMLQGIGEVTLAVGSPTIPFKETDSAYYFQDNWKIMNNLTLNLGLRYEYFGQAANALHNETVARQTGSNPFWSTSLPLSATTTPKVSSYFKNIEPRIGLAYSPSFLPKMVVHAGYSILVDPEFYELFINMATSAPAVNSGNFACDGVTVQCLPSGGLTFSTVQAADAQFLPIGGDPRANPIQTVPTNLRNPMSETYTLGFQYQVFPSAVATVSYLGNHTFRQFQAINSNPDILDVQSVFPGYGTGTTPCTDTTAPGYTRASCSNAAVLTYENTAFQIYNALQTSLTMRNFHGFSGTASYTYSREVDNASEFSGTGTGGGTVSAFAQNPLNTNVAERGVSGYSYPSIWGIQLTYTEPWFKSQHGILGRVLGGYYLNAFYQYNGGTPFNPIQNSYSVVSSNVLSDISGAAGNPGGITPATAASINTTQAEYSFCDVGFAQAPFGGNPCRPVLSNPKAPLSSIGINLGPGGYVDYVSGAPTTPSAEHWLWNNQYQAIAANNPFPGIGRNTLRGDSFNDIDLSMGKSFHITERVSMNIMASAFNVTNRAFYGIPDPNVEDSSFGGFLSSQFAYGTGSGSGAGGGSYPQGLGNRNVQLTGKIVF
jgi:outer membrane receptor protein involved in Fe transport